jgi:hypothetical protein
MPLNEIPKHLTPEVRSLIEAALEDAWQELNKDGTPEAAPARNKLRRTMVALAPLLEKPIIESSCGSPSMLGEKRSNRRQHYTRG